MSRRTFTLGLALLGVGLAAGCNSDPDAAIDLVPIKGTVTLNAEPMPNAVVSFIPDPGNKVSTAGGDTTGPDGNYIAQYRGRNGLSPGKYKVTITSGPDESVVADTPGLDPFMASEATRAATAGRRGAAKKQEVKEEFDAEVGESATVQDFNLKTTSK